jgi:hypothetical protein
MSKNWDIDAPVAGRQCHHCKEWIGPGAAHDCWSTTETALTGDLPEDLREAWERLRDAAVEFGDQRIYASGTAIMFSKKSCYFFVRPRRRFLEVCIFLGRAVRAPQIKRVERISAAKMANIVHIVHRDEVEPPITDWLQEAYDLPDKLAARKARSPHGRSGGKEQPAARRTRRVGGGRRSMR